MKTNAHRKILAVAVAVMLGLATTGGAALARKEPAAHVIAAKTTERRAVFG